MSERMLKIQAAARRREGLLGIALRVVLDPGRLRLKSLAALREHVARLKERRELRTDGAWTAGQILYHLAAIVELSNVKRTPGPRRRSRLLMSPIRVFVLRCGLPCGYPIPADLRHVLAPPASAEFAEQYARLLRAMAAFDSTTHERPDHPALGKLTADEWQLFHLRHAELHLGHIVESAHAENNTSTR